MQTSSTLPPVLLTAFEPFDNEPINPSWEVVKMLDGLTINGVNVVAVCLPCVFGESLIALEQAIRQHQPSIVISIGQAGGRTDISLERVAVNLDDARIPDNAGNQPIDEPVIANAPNAPVAYFTSLPVKAMLRDLLASGIPASVSYTAGSFVCNHVFFGLQHLAGKYGVTKSGFVHIPYLPEQAARHKGQPSMAKDTLLAGLKVMITTCVITDNDIKIVGGETH